MHLCVPAIATDICKQGGAEGMCYACTDPKKFPINYLKAANDHEFDCVDQAYDNYEKFLGNVIVHDLTNSNLTTVTIDAYRSVIYRLPVTTNRATFEAQTSMTYNDVCLRLDGDKNPHCVEFNDSKFKCSRCKKGYFLKPSSTSHNECLPISPGCVRLMPNSAECDICAKDYFKSSKDDCDYTSGSGYVVDTVCEGNDTINDGSCSICGNNNGGLGGVCGLPQRARHSRVSTRKPRRRVLCAVLL